MSDKPVVINDKSSVVADTIHGQISISSFEKDIIATTLFNRLHGIHQNSTAYMTFPANRTKRLEHSFGTMYLCGNIFSSSICNASPGDNLKFFQKAEEEINEIIKCITVNEGYNSKLGQLMKKAKNSYKTLQIGGGIYDRVLPGNVEADRQKLFIIIFESVRISGLLHDVGHPPFSHIAEAALNNVYVKIKNGTHDNQRITNFKEVMSPFYGKELHEQIGNNIAEALLKESIPNISENQAKDVEIYNKQLFRLIVMELVLKILMESDSFYADLHSIISGTLDGDRLDYVSRDPLNSGFGTGIIEYERLISNMRIVEKDSHFLFCPSASTINTIEDFLMRRWNMYCNIIFHHHVVKTDYLLQKSIEEITYEYLMNDEEEIDSDSYILPYDISGLWRAVKVQASVLERGYSISQWDDAWLTVVLKKYYFEKIFEDVTLLNKMLTELLTNKRQFASLIKRKEEFYAIDMAVAEEIVQCESEIMVMIQQLKTGQNTATTKEGVDIEGFISNIKCLFEKAKNYSKDTTLTKNDGFLLFYIRKILVTKPETDPLQEIVVNAVTQNDEENYMVVFKTPKTGTNKDLYLWKKSYNDNKDNQLETLKGISNISSILNNNLKFLPFFYIYVDMDKVQSESFDFGKKRTDIGKAIADGIYSYIKNFVNDI